MSSFLRSRSCVDAWQNLFDFFDALGATILFFRTDLDSGRFLCFNSESLVAFHLRSYKNWILRLSDMFFDHFFWTPFLQLTNGSERSGLSSRGKPKAASCENFLSAIPSTPGQGENGKKIDQKKKKVEIYLAEPTKAERACPLEIACCTDYSGFSIKMAWCYLGI